MITKHSNNPLIKPEMIKPSHPELVVKGALNPGAVEFEGQTILLLRIAEGCKKKNGKVKKSAAERLPFEQSTVG